MALPLLEATLDRFYLVDGEPLRARCARDDESERRNCQDVYALRCEVLRAVALGSSPNDADGELGGELLLAGAPGPGAAGGLTHRLSAPGPPKSRPDAPEDDAAARCVAEYDSPRPASRRFWDASHVHRQLPGLIARPWWPEELVPYPALRRVRAKANTIREEVLRVGNLRGGAPNESPWDPLGNDPKLGRNQDWDPWRAWDAVHLYFRNAWNDRACTRWFPATCKVLRDEEQELTRLFDTRRFRHLVARAVPTRAMGDDDEVPTLGVKLYRVHPRAGLKRHSGSPARLVSSLCLQAPEGSTITVANETRHWVEGEMHHLTTPSTTRWTTHTPRSSAS